MNKLDELCIKTLRFLAIDGIEQAKSGHPGMPLGAAPMAYVLWDRFLHYNPRNSRWFNRDRFILSAGHGSALLYSLLHLYGYDLSLEELKRFRQWGSKTPGHPEYGLTEGVESTTGPLGQGFGMGVGIAIAECFLASSLNQPRFPVVNHYTYAIVSDGDLMEGVSSEAASLAGHMGLGKLIYLYDDNHITIEGETDLAFTENVQKRFESYDWQVLRVPDGNDLVGIDKAIRDAQAEKKKPSLIMVRTHIGYGSPKQDKAAVHGEPLGPETLLATKENLGWPTKPTFHIPEEALNHFRQSVQRGEKLESEWQAQLGKYRELAPDIVARVEKIMRRELPTNWDNNLPIFRSQDGAIATRTASGKVMNILAKDLTTFIAGGSADLAPSTKTLLSEQGDFGSKNFCSPNIHFGVREHAMGAIANGMALHNLIVPYTGTFLIFSDYMRPAMRLSALMQTHVVFIFTHDSIGLGEDGPTHQPVEHLMSLRAIPGMTVIRPADANETVAAWRVAVQRKGPVVLALTRQKLPILDPDKYPILNGMPRGAYIMAESESGPPKIILIATGSEVQLALEAREDLKAKDIPARVVSMPSWEIFEEQSSHYKKQVFIPNVPKIAIEAGVSQGWRTYVGDKGDVIGLNRFGASAPGKIALEKLGFNVKNVVEHAAALVKK